MNTTMILVSELFMTIEQEVLWLIDNGHGGRGRELLHRVIHLHEGYVQRSHDVLGMQRLAQETAHEHAKNGLAIKPSEPPDSPSEDTTTIRPPDDR